MPVTYNDPYAVAPAALVDIIAQANATWNDGVQFDPPALTGAAPPPYYPPGSTTGPTWTFSGQNFKLDIKGFINQTGPSLSLDSGVTGCQLIVVDDAINRILHFNVSQNILSGFSGATGATGPGLIPGCYIYNFLMYDASVPPIVVPLMNGRFVLKAGV